MYAPEEFTLLTPALGLPLPLMYVYTYVRTYK